MQRLLFQRHTARARAVCDLLVSVGLLLALCPIPAAAQADSIPSSEREWQQLWDVVNRNPYHLRQLRREAALAIVVAAVATRPDRLLWAAYGPAICMVGGANRAVLRDSARLEAFQQSRSCFERILAALPGRGSSAEVENSRSILVGPLAEVLVEVGALVAADSLAAAELEQAAMGQRWFVGNIQYDMNQVRGRVALRMGRAREAIAFLDRASETAGSPQLATFGPGLVLARELLEAGHSQAVIRFLRDVGRFWAGPDAGAFLAEAIATIENGRVPDGPRWR